MGGYLSTFAPNIPTNLYAPLLGGVYTTPAIYCEVKVVFTNTVPVDAYRGAGRPEATFLLERLVDIAAADLGMDRVEIRRRNMIPKEAFPYQTPVMSNTTVAIPWAAWTAHFRSPTGMASPPAARSAKRGQLRGIGISTYVEACGLAPSRLAIRWVPAAGSMKAPRCASTRQGKVTVLIGTTTTARATRPPSPRSSPKGGYRAGERRYRVR